MPNEIVASRQQILAMISETISEGIVPSSRDAIPVRAKADSKRVFDQIRNEAGPEVFEAAEQIWADFAKAQANGELDAELAALEADNRRAALPNPGGAGAGAEILALADITPEERGLIVAAGALARRRDAHGVDVNRMPERTTQWHHLTATARDTATANRIRMAAPAIFKIMPCFAALAQEKGTRAVDDLKVVADYDFTPARPLTQNDLALLGGPQQIQHMQGMARETAHDVNTIGAWIMGNALRLQSSKMRFKQMKGYEPDVMFAASEDESFLLVRERRADGSPIDGQSIYAWPGGRQFYARNPEALLKLVEMMTAQNGIEIDFSPEGSRRVVRNAPPAQGFRQQRVEHQQQMPARAAAPEPVRQPRAAQQPAPARPAPRAQAPEPQARPEPEAPQAVEPQPAARRPVTRPVTRRATATRQLAAPVGRFSPLGMLRQEMGFEMSLVPARSGDGVEQAVHKKDDEGFIVIFADDGRKLPLAADFAVERRSTLQEPGHLLGSLSAGAGRDEFRDRLAGFSTLTGLKP